MLKRSSEKEENSCRPEWSSKRSARTSSTSYWQEVVRSFDQDGETREDSALEVLNQVRAKAEVYEAQTFRLNLWIKKCRKRASSGLRCQLQKNEAPFRNAFEGPKIPESLFRQVNTV